MAELKRYKIIYTMLHEKRNKKQTPFAIYLVVSVFNWESTIRMYNTYFGKWNNVGIVLINGFMTIELEIFIWFNITIEEGRRNKKITFRNECSLFKLHWKAFSSEDEINQFKSLAKDTAMLFIDCDCSSFRIDRMYTSTCVCVCVVSSHFQSVTSSHFI